MLATSAPVIARLKSSTSSIAPMKLATGTVSCSPIFNGLLFVRFPLRAVGLNVPVWTPSTYPFPPVAEVRATVIAIWCHCPSRKSPLKLIASCPLPPTPQLEPKPAVKEVDHITCDVRSTDHPLVHYGQRIATH